MLSFLWHLALYQHTLHLPCSSVPFYLISVPSISHGWPYHLSVLCFQHQYQVCKLRGSWERESQHFIYLSCYLLYFLFRYCDCFANGEFCNNCNCANCFNNLAHEEDRQKAIKACLDRNPQAFRPKIGKGGSDNERRHNKGCNCKRSGCLKNYCECYEVLSLEGFVLRTNAVTFLSRNLTPICQFAKSIIM